MRHVAPASVTDARPDQLPVMVDPRAAGEASSTAVALDLILLH